MQPRLARNARVLRRGGCTLLRPVPLTTRLLVAHRSSTASCRSLNSASLAVTTSTSGAIYSGTGRRNYSFLQPSARGTRGVCTGTPRLGIDPWELPDRDLVVRAERSGVLVLDVKKHDAVPFLKNLFCGYFSVDILGFPEVLTKIQVDELHDKLASLGYIDGRWTQPPSLDVLQEAGMFGAEIPASHRGLSYTATENMRMLEAAASSDHFLELLANNVAVQAVLQFGDEDQQRRWLPLLSTGNTRATFCLAELGAASDLNALQSSAQLTVCHSKLLLTGRKLGVPAAATADFMLVAAHTKGMGELSKRDGLSTLLVDRRAGGVTVTPSETAPGFYEVEFKDTPVPIENVIGDVGRAHMVLLQVLNHSRMMLAAQVAGWLRPLVTMTTQHCLHRPCFGRHLSDFRLIQSHLAVAARDLYKLESIAYVTAGIADLSLRPDYTLEAAVCKLQASELAQSITERCLRLLGTTGYYSNDETSVFARKCHTLARALSRHTGSDDMLKMFITLEGLQFVSDFHANDVLLSRNPADNPLYALKRALGLKTPLAPSRYDIGSYLHPSLEREAGVMENQLQLFVDSVASTLVQHGNDIMNQQLVLTWLAEALVQLYTGCAVLARASRSYCVGFQDAQAEMLLATSVVDEARWRIERRIRFIEGSPSNSPDVPLVTAAETLIQRDGYHLTHCLNRVI